MKANWLAPIFLLLLLSVEVLQLPAQQFNGNYLLFEQILERAENGDPETQYQLGLAYFNGLGVEKNYLEAAKWWRQAADQNYPKAQFKLGLCYYSGFGLARDYTQAADWWLKAAEAGNSEAQYNLGCCYYYGNGIAKNFVEADKWFKVALSEGNASATQLLPVVEQELTPPQISEAQKWASAFKPSQAPEAPEPDMPIPSETRPSTETAICGTGFFITEDGFLVTNNHVIRNATQVMLITRTGRIPATVVKVDVEHDLALLKADGNFSALSLAADGSVQLGSTVATVGFPDVTLQGFAPKLAKGEIAALSGIEDDPRYFQISVPVQPGNSGGALVDEHGNVVGVVSAKLNANAALLTSGALPENVNYAVKSSFLRSFLQSVPEVSDNLQTPNTRDEKFENVVKSAEQATVLVLAQ